MPSGPRLSLRLAALGLGGLLLVYLLLAVAFQGRADWYPGVSDAIVLASNILASAFLFYAAFKSRELGHRFFVAWIMLGIAQGLYVLGDAALITSQATLGEAPFHPIANALYLGYYIIFAIGLLLLPSDSFDSDERKKIILDIAIIMLSAGLLLGNFLIAPLATNAKAGLLEIFIALAHPALDLVLFFVLLHKIFRKSLYIGPILLLQASVTLAIICDVIHNLQNMAGAYASGNLVDLGFAASYSLTALAGVLQAERAIQHHLRHGAVPAVERSASWTIYIPYLWGWAAFLLVAFHKQASHLPSAILFGFMGGIFFLIMIRQILSYQENDRLYKSEQHRRRLAETLASAAQQMGASLDPRAVPGLVLEQLASVVPYERCSIMLEKKDHLYIAAQRGFPEGDHRTDEVNISIREDDPFLILSKTLEPVILDDVTQEPNWTILPWLPLNKSWMGVPLIVRDRVIGMISITRREASAFSQDDKVLAMAFAGQAAVVMDNALLYGDLDHAYRTLKVLDQAKLNFIEVVAHELRTPLTVIKGYTQVLSGQGSVRDDPQCQPVLDGIMSGSERMQSVVDNMLDMSKIENQVLQLYKMPFVLGDVFRQIANYYRTALVERNLVLELVGLERIPMIQADPDLLHKVFQQLVMNAIKYTPDGGKITVSGSLNANRDTVEIVIADTGIGIDHEQLEVIFEKFYQTGQITLHSSGQTKFKGGGPGLGLPLARGIVMAHGGEIWAKSPGHNEETFPGSKFYVQLPL